ncbi:flavin reductase family protein [Streptomyces similanensis]|uniref:Flavin reductase like domain-containing protein n=1 Tax=Streptomyces similanensis TaxID=1274988 RepID=A0ABP9LMF6_9ACTN
MTAHQPAHATHVVPAPTAEPSAAGPPGGAGADEFRAFMASWPSGVSVVTAQHRDEDPSGCTVNAVLSWSLRPPMIGVCLSATSRTLRAVRASGSFGVNILSWDQRRLIDQFATAPAHERFAGVDPLHPAGPALLRGAAAAARFAVCATFAYADHVLVIGQPVGPLHAEDVSPVVLHNRSRCHLTEV